MFSMYIVCSLMTNALKIRTSILSPLLYTVYADELMKSLELSGLGCCIGHIFAGALYYADGMKLLSPTRKGLQKK